MAVTLQNLNTSCAQENAITTITKERASERGRKREREIKERLTQLQNGIPHNEKLEYARYKMCRRRFYKIKWECVGSREFKMQLNFNY